MQNLIHAYEFTKNHRRNYPVTIFTLRLYHDHKQVDAKGMTFRKQKPVTKE